MSSDTIKRSDAIKATWQEPTYTDPLNVLTEVRDRIEAIPSADRPQGEWIRTERMGTFKLYDCSVCGIHIEAPWNFCPNCGADMRGAENE